MEEFIDGLKRGIALDFFLEEILDGLDIVIGGSLDVLHPLCIFNIEVLNDGIEQGVGFVIEGWYFGYRFIIGKRLQPAHFDHDAVMDQAEFTEQWS